VTDFLQRERKNMSARNQTEQPRRSTVKSLMNRVKVALIVFFPALWLLVSGQSAFNSGSDRASSGVCPDCSAAKCARHYAINSGYSFDFPARPLASRFAPKFSKNRIIPIEAASARAIERASLTVSARREGPSSLAASWQFVLRAAAEPRAPSSVS
jgi:hypothetical protein